MVLFDGVLTANSREKSFSSFEKLTGWSIPAGSLVKELWPAVRM